MRSLRTTLALAAALAVGAVATVFLSKSQAQPPAAGSPAKYTVVMTEGTNLLVVDNSTNMLHFYTVDPGKDVGDDLHLRGSLDLNEVGKPTLVPKKAAK